MEWYPAEAASNRRKHGVDFADAALALEDELALTVLDPDSDEEDRFVTLGMDSTGDLRSWSSQSAATESADLGSGCNQARAERV